MRRPLHDLRGLAACVGPGAHHTVSFDLTPRDLMLVNDAGACARVGPLPRDDRRQPADPRSAELTGAAPLAIEFDVVV